MREYPVSTSIHLTRDPSYRVAIDVQINRIIDGGFRWLEFNFLDHYYTPESPFVGDDWEAWIDLAGDTAAKRGVKWNQSHAPCLVFNCSKDMPLHREYCRRAFIGCQKLGIPWMVFHHVGNPINYGSNLSKYEYDKLYFSWMLEEAYKYNVGIAIENLFVGAEIDGTMASPVDYAIALASYFNDPKVGVCYDVGHGNIKKYNDCIDAYTNIKRIGRYLKATHIHDNSTADDDHIPPFMGTINWKGLMRGLDEIGYECSFTFEAHNTVSRMRQAGIDESVMDTAIHLLYQIGNAIVHMER